MLKRLIVALCALATLSFLGVAYAQATSATVDPSSILSQILTAAQGHNYQAVGALLLVVLVWAFRKYSPNIHGKLGTLVNSDRGGTVTVLVLGVLGFVASALVAKKPLNVQLVLGGVTTAVLASGGWNVVWDLLKPEDVKPVEKLEVPK